VRNLAAQDEAKDQISKFYSAPSCRLREVDRRADPRSGYRAVHLIVHVDELPVEIQIRTELQDSWAQIFERLADRWGRGIRYGQEPENPQGIVRSGESTYSRSELVAMLMRLSDHIWSVERIRRMMDALNDIARMLDPMVMQLRSDVPPESLASKIPPGLAPNRETMVAVRSALLDADAELDTELDTEFQKLAAIPVTELTGGQLGRMAVIIVDFLKAWNRAMAPEVAAHEAQVRDILRLIAGATDEGA
jgi:hypothetical protein